MSTFLVLAGCQTDVDNDANAEEKKAAQIEEKEDTITTIAREEYNGYWSDEDYIFFVSDSTFYMQDKNTLYVNSFSIENALNDENILNFTLGDLHEQESIALIEPNSDFMLTHQDEYLSFSEQGFENKQFLVTGVEEVSEQFQAFVKSDGLIGQLAYQGEDLTLDDFIGYYAPFDKYAINDGVRSDLGTYTVHLGEEFFIFAIPNSEASIFYYLDYDIQGNALTIHTEVIGTESLRMFRDRFTDFVERETTILTFSLFKEEDRNRLVNHRAGTVFQSVTEEEIKELNYGETYKKSWKNTLNQM